MTSQRSVLNVLVLVLVTSVLATWSGTLAQGQPPQAPGAGAGQGAPGGGGRGGGPAGAPARIDTATAKKALAAAEAAAAAANVRVAIAVVDANGDLVAFTRLDGASARAVTSSQGKARAAILFGLPTKQVQDAMAANQPLSVKVTNPPAGAWEITPAQGAVPVMKDGQIIAAVGVGGAMPALDEQIEMAGAAAIR
jgi:glc operon protein GlcG